MKRAFAKKVLINQIVNSEFIKKEGWEPSFVKVGNEEISLANIIGIVISNEGTSLVIDDGTGQLLIRFFDAETIPDVNVGDAVQVIGRVGRHENTIFLTGQLISKISIDWLKVRKQEIKEINFDKPVIQEHKEIVVEDIYGLKDNLVEIIRKMDNGEGVEISEIANNENKEKAIRALLEEGEIFEIRPGKLKVLD